MDIKIFQMLSITTQLIMSSESTQAFKIVRYEELIILITNLKHGTECHHCTMES